MKKSHRILGGRGSVLLSAFIGLVLALCGGVAALRQAQSIVAKYRPDRPIVRRLYVPDRAVFRPGLASDLERVVMSTSMASIQELEADPRPLVYDFDGSATLVASVVILDVLHRHAYVPMLGHEHPRSDLPLIAFMYDAVDYRSHVHDDRRVVEFVPSTNRIAIILNTIGLALMLAGVLWHIIVVLRNVVPACRTLARTTTNVVQRMRRVGGLTTRFIRRVFRRKPIVWGLW